MNIQDPNISIVELVADALQDLREELVLVGGCSVGLLITDKARPPVRQTVDVDLVAQVISVTHYYQDLSTRLRDCGFTESPEESNMCRWKKGGLLIDVMPSDQKILGHSTNRWYPAVIRDAKRVTLTNGTEILLVSAPAFVATKLEAFHDRGGGDFLSSHDMEDIINVVDGRDELVQEVKVAPADLNSFIRDEIDDLLANTLFVDQIPAYLKPDPASQARAKIVLDRLRAIAGI